MGDRIQSLLDRISILFGVQPWIVILTLVFLIGLLIGLRLLVRLGNQDRSLPDWRRDPDELPDLSPRLRQVRLQLIGTGLPPFAPLPPWPRR